MKIWFTAVAMLFAACHRPALPTTLPPAPTAKLADLDDSYTDDDVRREAADKACPTIVRPRLWRVEKGGKTSHLFGTYHYGVSSTLLPAVVTDAFDSARVVAFESVESEELVASITEDAPARSLSAELGREAWSRFEMLAGAEIAAALETESATAAIVILSMMYMENGAALDNELEQRARSADKPVVGLETAASLEPVIRQWLGARTLRAVVMASRGRRDMRDRALAKLADYCAGRDRGEDPFDDVSGVMSAADLRQMNLDLLDNRNLAWMKPLEPLLAEGGAFVAVGAAHLRGSGSVVDLLRRRGYRVTRVE